MQFVGASPMRYQDGMMMCDPPMGCVLCFEGQENDYAVSSRSRHLKLVFTVKSYREEE